MRTCAFPIRVIVVLVVFADITGSLGQAVPCPLLDSNGCCGLQCQLSTCQTLHTLGAALGAVPTPTAPSPWINLQGWKNVTASASISGRAACQQYIAATTAAGNTAGPGYCSWHGISCNQTAYSNSCSLPAASYAVSTVELVNNNLTGLINDTAFLSSLQALHDCGLRKFVIGGASFGVHGSISPVFGRLNRLRTLGIFTTNITGSLPPEMGAMSALEELYLQGNYLYGTLPEELGSLQNLRVLNLGKNGFTDWGLAMYGSLPKSFARLRQLEVLSLETNAFSGTLPPHICRNMTALNAVGLRSNRFTGSANMLESCMLVSLDISDNYFSGSLPRPPPGSRAWEQLVILRLSNNDFTGSLPDVEFGQAPVLTNILLANNSISGTIPRSWTSLPWLGSVDLSFNNITGTLPHEFAFQARMTSLVLNNNLNLTGTISPWYRLATALERLHLQNTDIEGALPGITRAQRAAGVVPDSRICGSEAAGLGRLPNLQSVLIVATEMTARCGVDNELDDIDQALPWYLEVDNHTWNLPLSDPEFANNTGLECPRIVQKQWCNLNQPPQNFTPGFEPEWVISPSYYHYLGCRCLANYEARWDWASLDWQDGCRVKRLTCTLIPDQAINKDAIFGISFSTGVVFVALLSYCLYVSWYGRWGLPKLKRAYDDIKKRRDGAPKSGKVSVVVTDIEGYSALMVSMPLIMGRALSQHNNVMRRAAWTHYGFVVGQEGDSYLLAFREALDAVAFCLQVQQALMKVDWPTELLQHQQQQDRKAAGLTAPSPVDPNGSNHNKPRHSVGSEHANAATNSDSGVPASGLSLAALASGIRARRNASHACAPRDAGISSSGTSINERLPQQQALDPSSMASAVDHSNGSASSSAMASATAMKPIDSFSSTTAGSGLWQQGPLRSVSFGSMAPSAQRADTPTLLPTLSIGSDGLAQLASAAGGTAEVPKAAEVAAVSVMVPGLRVRMGVASGFLNDKEDCLSSKVLEVARVVSDAGSGGQVLVDSTTFSLIKDRLEELGQVGPSGYSKKSRVTGWGTPRGWLARRLRKHVQLSAEVFVLDMGLYSIPGFTACQTADAALLLPDVPAAVTDVAVAAAAVVSEQPAGTAAATPATSVEPSRCTSPTQQQQQVAQAVSAAVAADAAAGCLRLYQVLAPRLLDRAHVYGNKLQLAPGSTLHDLPYFCAPASTSRSLLDQLLMQSPGLHTLWKHGSSSGSGTSKGRPSGTGPPGGSRVLSGYADQQQRPQSPVPSAAATRASGLGRQLHQQTSTASTYSSTDGMLGYVRALFVETAAAPQQRTGAGRSSADGGGNGRAAKDDGQQSPVFAAASGGSSVWLLPQTPLLQPLRGNADDAVTFVFCTVVPPKSWVMLDPYVFDQVASIISRVLRQCLLALAHHSSTAEASIPAAGGSDAAAAATAGVSRSGSSGVQACGYLCREMVTDMKYLLVFHSPRLALEWCLLVQEVMLWQDWPTAVLDKQGRPTAMLEQQQPPNSTAAAAAKDPALSANIASNGYAGNEQQQQGGSLLFRGPRIKMGVACGAPQAVCPDHLGRADYHGNSINMAARYEAVCSQGGQVVCDAALAAAVVAEWTELAAARAAAAEQAAAAEEDAAWECSPQDNAEQQQMDQELEGRRSSSPFAAAEVQQPQPMLQQQQASAAVQMQPPVQQPVQQLLLPSPTATTSGSLETEEFSFSTCSPAVEPPPASAAAAAATTEKTDSHNITVAAVAGDIAVPTGSPIADTAVRASAVPINIPSPHSPSHVLDMPESSIDNRAVVGSAPSSAPPFSKAAAAAARLSKAPPQPPQQQQQQATRQSSSGSSFSKVLSKTAVGKDARSSNSYRRSSASAIELPVIASGDATAAAAAVQQAVSIELPGPSTAAAAAVGGSPTSSHGGGGFLSLSTPRRTSTGQTYSTAAAGASAAATASGLLHSSASTQFTRRVSTRKILRSAAAAATAAVHMDPTPIELPCSCCVSELPSENFTVEVQQVGKFIVKGQPMPVDIVEVALSHLASRRQLLADAPLKCAKGHLVEPLAAKCAVVPSVLFPAVALRYRQQYERHAAAAAVAATLLPIGSTGQPPVTRSQSGTLRQRSLPVGALVSRTVSSFTGGNSGSTASVIAGGRPPAAVMLASGQGSWVRRAFSLSSTTSNSSGGSSPRAGNSRRQLDLQASVPEDSV